VADQRGERLVYLRKGEWVGDYCRIQARRGRRTGKSSVFFETTEKKENAWGG